MSSLIFVLLMVGLCCEPWQKRLDPYRDSSSMPWLTSTHILWGTGTVHGASMNYPNSLLRKRWCVTCAKRILSRDAGMHTRHRHRVVPDSRCTGLKIAHLTLMHAVRHRNAQGQNYLSWFWTCRCRCGKTTVVLEASLLSGNTKSCGCVHNKPRKHGMCQSYIYKIWAGMLSRCNRPNHVSYHNYGGRGIRVCHRWEKFENFYKDMGDRPSKNHTLERLNNDGNYDPKNCVWATYTEQGQNKRETFRVTYLGRTQSVTAWAREVGISHWSLKNRLLKGATVKEAMTISAPSTSDSPLSISHHPGHNQTQEAVLTEDVEYGPDGPRKDVRYVDSRTYLQGSAEAPGHTRAGSVRFHRVH